jgi:DNA-binding HxlR family transcriptional regulator
MSTTTMPAHADLTYTSAAVRPSAAKHETEARDAVANRLLGQTVRLGILSALLEHDTLSFVELRDRMGTTDGNLSMHARKLEDAQIVACTKGYQGRQPRTEYRLTPEGRLSVLRYLHDRGR